MAAEGRLETQKEMTRSLSTTQVASWAIVDFSAPEKYGWFL